uniref:Uncharacterized protein n=1 Tax=Romanomermis culicivorax TaxID=13658 RepID=A0A915LDB5_ROMCU
MRFSKKQYMRKITFEINERMLNNDLSLNLTTSAMAGMTSVMISNWKKGRRFYSISAAEQKKLMLEDFER